MFTIRHGPSFSLGGSIGSGKGVVDISLRHLQDVGGARALVAAIIAVIDPITAATHPTCTVVTQVLPSAADYQKKIIIDLHSVEGRMRFGTYSDLIEIETEKCFNYKCKFHIYDKQII